jgi:glycerophosphoryl diester phosphodiesterase
VWDRLPVEYVIPHYTLVAEPLIRQFRNAGRKILAWTVNSPRDMQRLADSGVDGIISDNTSLLCRTLSAWKLT